MQTTLNRDVLISLLRREVARTPTGIPFDLSRSSSRSAPFVFLVSQKDLSGKGYEFLESILRGMKIDSKDVLITANVSEISAGSKFLVRFGVDDSINSLNLECLQTASVDELQSNPVEKKKLWNQLKVWLQAI